jgi:hypothetical protein
VPPTAACFRAGSLPRGESDSADTLLLTGHSDPPNKDGPIAKVKVMSATEPMLAIEPPQFD